MFLLALVTPHRLLPIALQVHLRVHELWSQGWLSQTIITFVPAFPYAFFCETEKVAEALSPYAGSAHAETSSRFSVSLERTWILHSGNNTLRDVVNLSSASESPVRMIILSTFKFLSATSSVAFQILRRAKHNQVDQNSRVPSENS